MCIISGTDDVDFIDFKYSGIPGYVEALVNLQLSHMFKHVCLESVHSMPGQGVKSMFSFGQRFGELNGMLQTLGLGYSLLRPKEWQKIVAIKDTTSKQGIHATISTIYPKAPLKGPKGGILDGRCDALGIAHAARIKYNK